MSTSGSFVPAGTPPCPAPMTRAALLALRAGAALRPECHYVITDGPVIGVTGNTSATQIELHALSATELGLEARVHTTFDDTAWDGLYDIDLGTAGSIVRLTDNRINTVEDRDADSPTVHTQFPWGSAANLRDNYINDMSLPNWANLTAADAIQDCRIIGGNTTGTFDLGGSGTVTMNGCEIVEGAGVFTRNGNCALTLNRVKSTFWTATLNGAGGGITMFDCSLRGNSFQRAAAANTTSTFTNVTADGLTVNFTGTGPVVMSNTSAEGAIVTVAATATRGLTITGSVLSGASTIAQQRTVNGNADFIVNTRVHGSSTLTLTGAAGATGVTSVVQGSLIEGQSVVTLTDPVANALFNTDIHNTSTVNVAGGGALHRSRVAAQMTLNTGAFTHQQSIFELPAATKTLTAANVNRLANKSFDDTV